MGTDMTPSSHIKKDHEQNMQHLYIPGFELQPNLVIKHVTEATWENPGGVAGRWCMASLGRERWVNSVRENPKENSWLPWCHLRLLRVASQASKEKWHAVEASLEGSVNGQWTAFSFTSMMFSFWCFLGFIPRLCKFKHYINIFK